MILPADRFPNDPRVPLDNSVAERALRGVVVGRKNHYNSRSKRGTEVAAIFYTRPPDPLSAHREPDFSEFIGCGMN